jgi:hypothetical protein
MWTYNLRGPKKLVYFKKNGRVHSLTIPVRRALDFKMKDCPICAVMKDKTKEPTAVLVEETRQWKPWEKVFSDSSGKFKFAVMSWQEIVTTASSFALALDGSCAQGKITLSYDVLEILGWNGTFPEVTSV